MWTISTLVLWGLIYTKMAGKKKGTGGQLIGSLFISLTILALVMSALDYFGTDDGQNALAFLVVGCIFAIVLYFIITGNLEKKRSEQRRKNLLLSEKIEHVTKHENIKGFYAAENFGWVQTNGKETRRDVEGTLKVLAAGLGANAIVNLSYQYESERYQAGKGPKGNPFYKNRTVFAGEAVAVLLEKNKGANRSQKVMQSRKKPDFTKYEGNNIALDGNNIVGRSGWEFGPITNLLSELRQSSYEYKVFFDNSIFRALKEKDLISKGQSINECLSNIMGESTDNIVVTPKQEQADPYIIEYAVRRNAAIISNDGYDDFISEYPWLGSGDNTLNFEVVGAEVLVPKLNLLPKP